MIVLQKRVHRFAGNLWALAVEFGDFPAISSPFRSFPIVLEIIEKRSPALMICPFFHLHWSKIFRWKFPPWLAPPRPQSITGVNMPATQLQIAMARNPGSPREAGPNWHRAGPWNCQISTGWCFGTWYGILYIYIYNIYIYICIYIYIDTLAGVFKDFLMLNIKKEN